MNNVSLFFVLTLLRELTFYNNINGIINYFTLYFTQHNSILTSNRDIRSCLGVEKDLIHQFTTAVRI